MEYAPENKRNNLSTNLLKLAMLVHFIVVNSDYVNFRNSSKITLSTFKNKHLWFARVRRNS